MPTYDYRCEKCGQVFEMSHAFDAKPPETCCDEHCDGTLRRIFSPPTIIFKGSGWHVNDYGRGSNGSGKRSPSPESKVEEAREKIEAGGD